jgi:hypothetical protein
MIMEEKLTIKYLNKLEEIIKFTVESPSVFNKRIELIRLMESDKISWKEALKISKIWYNIKFNNAKYNSELYNKYLHYDGLLK